MRHSNLPGKPAARVFLQDGKRQLHKQSRTSIQTNLDREIQKIQERLAKPPGSERLKHKWSKKKKKKKIISHTR